jgi:glycosyltransferase involved in cell wall biosynthesis
MEKPITSDKVPSISVIIPAYNQADYVSLSIQSVLAQTFADFELIVVDDGSTDETPRILAGIQDPRVHVIRQPNRGLSAARNTGLYHCVAPIVTFLDADDYFLPHKLEILMYFLSNHQDIGLVAGRAVYIDHMGNTMGKPVIATTRLGLPELLLANPICVSGILLRRKWLEKTGTFDETLNACEDWDLWMRLLLAGCQMAWLEHDVVAYRIHSGQMTSQAPRMRIAMFSMLNKFFSRSDLPEFCRTFKERAYASALVNAAAYEYLSNEIDIMDG